MVKYKVASLFLTECQCYANNIEPMQQPNTDTNDVRKDLQIVEGSAGHIAICKALFLQLKLHEFIHFSLDLHASQLDLSLLLISYSWVLPHTSFDFGTNFQKVVEGIEGEMKY